jgi:SH3-like domain-containing protein
MKNYAWKTFFLLLVWVSAASAERLTVSVSIANIRSGPGKNYDILWSVEKYHPLDVFQKSGQWYHFRDFEGDEGWINKTLLGNFPSIITKTENCNIRSGPDTNFEILFEVEKGIPFKVLERKGSWIHIQHADGDKGWIHESLVW